MKINNEGWTPLESNAATFNMFLSKTGVKGVECIDVFSFDDEVIQFVPKPQLAIIFCFPDYKMIEKILNPLYEELRKEGKMDFPEVFFMKQKVAHTDSVFALFHAIANLEQIVDTGNESFAQWLQQAKATSIDDRADLLHKSEALAEAYAETVQREDSPQSEKEERHFICYVNKNGNLYELDSRAPFPRLIGTTSTDTLVKDAGEACKGLIKRFKKTNLSAMALIKTL
ncbi:unnamed protein product [Auanema sp. JU1783]|nr:unnamed protein product [Auanema sp. JU1783]